ncbi:hypothetical protein AB0N73_09420 [Microbacterium sp. NPDC089189]|uniref:hypothetical protein n=1 Tax=Microbacterium sp. NPDC089189 TaxID=3154972 RepID=UPI003431C32D
MSTVVPTATTGRTTSFSRSWPSAAAWGAGLVQASLGAGAVVASESTPAARALGVLLVSAGLAALVWGGVCLHRGRLVLPTVALTASLAGMLAVTGLLAILPERTSVLAVGIAIVLLMVVAIGAVAARRRSSRPATPSVWGLMVAAALIAVLVTPALGAVQNSIIVQEDGTLPVVPTHSGH